MPKVGLCPPAREGVSDVLATTVIVRLTRMKAVRVRKASRYSLFMSKTKAKQAPRNSVVVEMNKRYGTTTTTMRDRRDRRPKDARRSWKNECHS